ncbi:MAG: VanZ family protein, partial [Myxococcales bacterium]|nr:VanZ family protein [Myxococcales bacterium]
MRARVLPIVLAVYAVFIVAIIVAANLGGTNEVFHLITRLPLGDKIGHFVLIGVLGMLVDLVAGRRDARPLRAYPRLRFPLAPAILFVVVLGEELSQAFLPTRTCDAGDLLADLLGMATFVGIGRLLAASSVRQRCA